MKKLAVLLILLSVFVYSCAWNMNPIDIGSVQSKVIKGKTTMAQIEQMYGAPYEKGISKNGNTYYYYVSANMITGSSQNFTFYFKKNGTVASYASEYPGLPVGHPLSQ